MALPGDLVLVALTAGPFVDSSGRQVAGYIEADCESSLVYINPDDDETQIIVGRQFSEKFEAGTEATITVPATDHDRIPEGLGKRAAYNVKVTIDSGEVVLRRRVLVRATNYPEIDLSTAIEVRTTTGEVVYVPGGSGGGDTGLAARVTAEEALSVVFDTRLDTVEAALPGKADDTDITALDVRIDALEAAPPGTYTDAEAIAAIEASLGGTLPNVPLVGEAVTWSGLHVFGLGRIQVGATAATARLPFSSSVTLDATAAGTTGTDIVGHLLATTLQGDYSSMGGPNPGILFGTNIFSQTTTASGGVGGVISWYGALIEADIRTPDVNYTNVRGLVAEAAFMGATAGGTVTNMISLRVANPKRKDGATGGVATNAYGIYIDPVSAADTGATNAFSLYMVGGLARFIGAVEMNAGAAATVPLILRSFASSPTGNFLEMWDATGVNRKVRFTKDGLMGVSSSVIAAEGGAQVTFGAHGPSSEAGILFGASGTATDTTFGYRAAATVIRHPHFHQFAQFISMIEIGSDPSVAADRFGWYAFDVSGKTQARGQFNTGGSMQFVEQDGPGFYIGTGSPESVVTAGIGSIYRSRTGGTGTTVYLKESGSGNTGWVAVAAGGGGSYTDEQAQDAVGTILVDSTEIDFTYADATPSITAALVAGSIAATKLATAVNTSLGKADTAIQNLAGLSITATATELNYTSGVTSAIQTQLGTKAPLASPTFTGTVAGITKSMVGLGSVDNTADTAKPVSTAQQTALDLKAPLASPTFTGTVTLPVGLTGVLRADTGVVSADSDVTDIVAAATSTAAGKVELATDAETTTGTDTVRAITPANLTSQIGSRVQAYDADLATIAGLTATTDNMIVSVSSAWASRTPAQVRTTLKAIQSSTSTITDTIVVTAAAYAALGTKDATTLYVIVG